MWQLFYVRGSDIILCGAHNDSLYGNIRHRLLVCMQVRIYAIGLGLGDDMHVPIRKLDQFQSELCGMQYQNCFNWVSIRGILHICAKGRYDN